MNRLYRSGALLAALLLSLSVHAGDIQIDNAWSRATAPGQDSGMADLTITSKQAAKLVGASTPAAKSVELHTMSHEGGMMKMREVKGIELPAGKAVNLGDKGYHLMLLGLKAPLKAGETVPLTLTVKAGKNETRVEVMVEVKPLTESKNSHEHQHHNH